MEADLNEALPRSSHPLASQLSLLSPTDVTTDPVVWYGHPGEGSQQDPSPEVLVETGAASSFVARRRELLGLHSAPNSRIPRLENVRTGGAWFYNSKDSETVIRRAYGKQMELGESGSETWDQLVAAV